MSTANKIIILVALVLLSFGYAFYSKLQLDSSFNQKDSVTSNSVLREIPNFQVFDLKNNIVQSSSFKGEYKAYYVHIWGTWCGPCEAEFGDLLNFASKFENNGIGFYLIAVNDEVLKIGKFLKRYKSIPKNVFVLIDQNNQLMDKFGTYKVPETFLFGSTDQVLNKYSGPQEWMKDIYTTQLSQLIK